MKGALLLDVIVGQGATILKLFSGEDETLLIWGDSLLVLDLRLNVVDGVGRLHLEGNGLSGEGLDENLHDGQKGRGGLSVWYKEDSVVECEGGCCS